MLPCLKLWAYVEQFVASDRTFNKRCNHLWYLFDGMGPVHSCSSDCFWLQAICQCRISVWHSVLVMPWQRKPNWTAQSAYVSVEKSNCNMCICCVSFTNGTISLSLAKWYRRLYLLARWFCEASQTFPSAQTPHGRWTWVGTVKVFLSVRKDCLALSSATVWEELPERLIPTCALVNVFKIFF